MSYSAVEILEDILIKNKASTAADAVSQVLTSTDEWLSLEEEAELYRLADRQLKNNVLHLFKEGSI